METEVIYGRTQLPALNISSFTMLQIPAYARAMDFLSGNLASFPIGIYEDEMQTSESHYLDSLLCRRANQMQNSFSMLRQWYLDGENRGNGYAFLRRNSNADPTIMGIYNLSPDDVTPIKVIPEDLSMFDSQLFYWHAPTKKAIPAADVLHYKPGLCYDGLIGYAPYQLWAGTFQRAQALQLFLTKYCLKGSMVKASIEVPAGTPKEQQGEIIAAMKSFRAETSDRDMILLTGGATMKNQTGSSQSMQLIEQDEAITKKISQITGVPQQFLMDFAEQKYNAASVEALGQDVVRFCFRTRLENIEDELTLKLLTEDELDQGMTIRLDTSALIRGDTAVEMTVASTGVNQGLVTPNEGRAEIGLQPIASPENDKLRVPTHLVANPADSASSESESHAVEPPTDQYAAFKPLIDSAITRVETKTAKALQTAAKKPDAERTAYTNVLADQQASYCVESLSPIGETILKLCGKKIDVATIGERYAAEIRRRAAGQEPKELTAIVGEVTNAG